MRPLPILARILHEAFGCERRKHGIFGSILDVRTRMYFSTIRPRTSRINFALRARTFRTSTTLASKFRAICGLAYLFAGILLVGCETQAPSRPVGSGCQYRDIPGTCRFDSITPSGRNTYGEGFRTLFSFRPDGDRETAETGVRAIIGDGKDPTKRYLAENRIEVGSETLCVRRVRIQGPCSPEVFEFPGLKNVY